MLGNRQGWQDCSCKQWLFLSLPTVHFTGNQVRSEEFLKLWVLASFLKTKNLMIQLVFNGITLVSLKKDAHDKTFRFSWIPCQFHNSKYCSCKKEELKKTFHHEHL